MLQIELQKGITKEAEGRYFYDFGIRKPAPNTRTLLKDECWKLFMNKWVWADDCDEEDTLVFFKHFYRNGRLHQLIYSGVDIIGDGVYMIFDARVHIVGENVFIEPNEFEMIRGSFEEEDFLQYLFNSGYITKNEYAMLSDKKKSREWIKKLRKMRMLFVKDKQKDNGNP